MRKRTFDSRNPLVCMSSTQQKRRHSSPGMVSQCGCKYHFRFRVLAILITCCMMFCLSPRFMTSAVDEKTNSITNGSGVLTGTKYNYNAQSVSISDVTSYENGLTINVYDNEKDTVPLENIIGSYGLKDNLDAGILYIMLNTEKLSEKDPRVLPAGTYYVSCTEAGKTESDRVKVEIKETMVDLTLPGINEITDITAKYTVYDGATILEGMPNANDSTTTYEVPKNSPNITVKFEFGGTPNADSDTKVLRFRVWDFASVDSSTESIDVIRLKEGQDFTANVSLCIDASKLSNACSDESEDDLLSVVDDSLLQSAVESIEIVKEPAIAINEFGVLSCVAEFPDSVETSDVNYQWQHKGPEENAVWTNITEFSPTNAKLPINPSKWIGDLKEAKLADGKHEFRCGVGFANAGTTAMYLSNTCEISVDSECTHSNNAIDKKTTGDWTYQQHTCKGCNFSWISDATRSDNAKGVKLISNGPEKALVTAEDGSIYGIANYTDAFEDGSWFWVRELTYSDSANSDYQKYLAGVDANIRAEIENNQITIILLGVTHADGVTEYTNFKDNKKVDLYFDVTDLIGKGYDYEDIQALYIDILGEDLEFDEEYVEIIPGRKHIHIIVSHFSPYALYDKYTDSERSSDTQINAGTGTSGSTSTSGSGSSSSSTKTGDTMIESMLLYSIIACLGFAGCVMFIVPRRKMRKTGTSN